MTHQKLADAMAVFDAEASAKVRDEMAARYDIADSPDAGARRIGRDAVKAFAKAG